MYFRLKKLELVKYQSPLSDLTPEQRSQALGAIGAGARKQHFETTEKLLRIVSHTDAVGVLVRMGFRFFAIQSSTGIGSSKEPAGHQHHLEILQAFALRFPRSTPDTSIRMADLVSEVIDALDKNTRAFNLQRVASTPSLPDNLALVNVQEQIRGDTQFVRGEFHPHQLDLHP